MMLRIDSFPSFVNSCAEFSTKRISFNGAEWHLKFELYKYCQTTKKNILLTQSSPGQPETLGVFVCGTRGDPRECSFDVDAAFAFKRPPAVTEHRLLSHKYCFSEAKNFDSWGYPQLAKIPVSLTLHLFNY